MSSTAMMDVDQALASLGCTSLHSVVIGDAARRGDGEILSVCSPIDGRELASISMATPLDVDLAAKNAVEAFQEFRILPGPLRGEFVRRYGQVLREHSEALAALVTWEAGKTRSEARGEVQEMIDVCDFAVGLSRQLYGRTMTSERAGHRLSEAWQPLGPVGVITAFNFPVAVWAWNAAIAWVCGDPVIWKPSEKTPLTALACQALFQKAAATLEQIPPAISSVLIGGREIGETLAQSRALPLISATGSVAMGRHVGRVVAERLGRSLLELGGNNAVILAPSADLELALRGVVFAATGTTGQRCTTLRRLIVHESIRDAVMQRLKKAYASLSIGDPCDESKLIGPLIDEAAYTAMCEALKRAQQEGGVVCGGERYEVDAPQGGVYVRPAIVEIESSAQILQEETFAPILYVIPYKDFEEALAINNGVPQGLSSAIFTQDMREAERFCGPAGSDCGIVNVNVGTSGAEIGGAFGGEKDTGGGRESGSDAWKAYMRRMTTTVNYSDELPLAQGVEFDLDTD